MTWKMRIHQEAPHFCSKTETESQFCLPCFDCLSSIFFYMYTQSPEQVWAAPLVLGHPAQSPGVTLGRAALCTFLWGTARLPMTYLIHSPSVSQNNNKNSNSASSSYPRATNQHQGGLVSRTSNTSGRTQESQKALRDSGNSFLHFIKNASLGIDKIKKDGWQEALK